MTARALLPRLSRLSLSLGRQLGSRFIGISSIPR